MEVGYYSNDACADAIWRALGRSPPRQPTQHPTAQRQRKNAQNPTMQRKPVQSVSAAMATAVARADAYSANWRPEETLSLVAQSLLRELVTEILADGSRSRFVEQAWSFSTSDAPKTAVHEIEILKLGRFLCCVVPPQDFATLVHRLQRRTCGLGDAWREFCAGRRDIPGAPWRREMASEDPRAVRSELLLEFICEALTHSPYRVAGIKGPHAPFMEVVVRVASRRAERRMSDGAAFAAAEQAISEGRKVQSTTFTFGGPGSLTRSYVTQTSGRIAQCINDYHNKIDSMSLNPSAAAQHDGGVSSVYSLQDSGAIFHDGAVVHGESSKGGSTASMASGSHHSEGGSAGSSGYCRTNSEGSVVSGGDLEGTSDSVHASGATSGTAEAPQTSVIASIRWLGPDSS